MQVEIKGFIHAEIKSYQPDEPSFSFSQCKDMAFLDSKYTTHVLVMPHTLTVDIGDFKADYREIRIEALRKEEIKLRADFAKRCAEINDEISKLQAITYEPSTSNSDFGDITF